MKSSLSPWVALIRAIGPATYKKMSMQQLREGCERAGLADVRTYIASGNLLFRSGEDAAVIKGRIDEVIAGHGLENAVFLRQPHELEALLSNIPFQQASIERPNHVLAVFLERPADEDGLAALDRLPGPERIAAVGREVFVDYAEGVGQSKVTPALLERRLKQPGTARNMNTVRKLLALVGEH